LRALGELKVNDLDKTPQISGALSVAQFDLAKFLDSIGNPLPPMAEGSLSKVELVSRLQGTPTRLALEDLNLKLDSSTFTGRVAVDDFAKQSLRVQLKGDTFNADDYLPAKSESAKAKFRTAKPAPWPPAAPHRCRTPPPKAPGAPTSCCR